MVRVRVLDPTLEELPVLLEQAGFHVVDVSADAVVLRSEVRLDRARLELLRGEGLRLVVRAGSGLDNIDQSACADLGIAVRSTPGPNARSVAEVALALALALVHRLGAGARGMYAGRFDKGALVGRELRDIDAGIVGFGAT